MDVNGNLVVTDESRDIEGYRKYIFPEPKEEAPPKETSSGSMSDSMAPPGYPAGKPGKPGKPQAAGKSSADYMKQSGKKGGGKD
jgi:hypothetical protein